MGALETKTIKDIEEKMRNTPDSSLRYQALKSAKNFKTSWIDLGQALYTVYRDKLYKDWGYSSFDGYTSKEVGIRKQTALKLLKSYYFLEQKEPLYLKQEYNEQAEAASVPTYESVDALRLANTKKEIDNIDYEQMKKNVLEQGQDARSVKKDLTALIKQRQELLPEQAWQKKRLALLKRFVSLLNSVSEEIKLAKVLPAQVVNDVDKLIAKIKAEIE